MPRRFSRPSARAARERQQLHSVVLRAPGAAPARRWRLELFRTRRDGMVGCIEYVVGEYVGHCAAGVFGLTKRHAKRHGSVTRSVTRPSSARCAAEAAVAEQPRRRR